MREESLRQRFKDQLESRGVPWNPQSAVFAVDFARLATKAIGLDRLGPHEKNALLGAIRARAGLDELSAIELLELTASPTFAAGISARELATFASRFGQDAADFLEAELEEELDLEGFSRRYGTEEALLLLDTLFKVAAAGGDIDDAELRRLEQASVALGVDGVLFSALLKKHDPASAAGARVYKLQGKPVVVGRGKGCDLHLSDPQVAERHARILPVGGGWRIVDLESGRPTVVNGSPAASAPLPPGSIIQIGPFSIKLMDGELHIDSERSFSALSVRRLSRKIGEVTLLGDVSFTLFSGELVALVGPSGAGKTTLLNAISGIAPADSGEVILDGQDFHRLLAADRSMVGNVPQEDLVLPELTVAESLFYSGRLRYPSDVGDDVIRAKVDKVLEELGIEHIRDSRIGDALRRGISGGQRKRVNLGQELMTTSTRVLFLDEPTSGLDPLAAQEIVRLVRLLADRGRIVFLVTHDLTPAVMNQCDHLLLIAQGGRLAFFGTPAEACQRFEVPTPDALFNRLGDVRPEEWATAYKQSSEHRKYVATREHLLGLDGLDLGADPAPMAMPQRSVLKHLATLTSRYARSKVRDRTGMWVLAAQPPLLAGVMWIVFPVPTAPLMFMLALSALWFGMSCAVRELITDRVVWRRERRVGVGVLPYLGSKVVVLGVISALQNIALASLIWGSMHMWEYGFSVLALCTVCVLTGWSGMTLGLLVSASWTSSEAAVGTLPLLLIPQIMFSSIMVSIRNMGAVSRSLTWVTVQRWSFDAVIKCGDKLGAPTRKPGEWDSRNITGALYELGLKPPGMEDMGLTLTELSLGLGGFAVLFMLVTGALVWWRDRSSG